MTKLSPENRGFFWSVLFFRRLFDHGVSQVIISPGSRSTPLTLAAASHPGLTTRVILDERSAAFTALGIGKATGTPAVLVCTSGTAAANYYPAVIESRLSGVPLILATADRPPHLRNTGANQAIDQLKIFGAYPVFSHEVGEPVFENADLSRLRMLAGQAVDLSVTLKGPVHLNFPFRKPLEPTPKFISTIERDNTKLASDQSGKVRERSFARMNLPPHIRSLIEKANEPLIIVGPLASNSAAKTIEDLAETIQAPILSEGGFSSPNNICGFEGFLRNKQLQDELAPDLILRFGFQPTGKSIERAMEKWAGFPHLHFAGTNSWQDATFSAIYRIDWQEQPVEWNVAGRSESGWISRWKSAEVQFRKELNAQLSGEPNLTDLHVYHHLTPQIPEHWNVFLSNSFPVRDSLLAGQYKTPSVLVNRGASGIDGITSTAIGVNLALDQPTVLFTGDLAFLHDTNALLSNKLLRQPVIVIVINNNGGNVFRMLPIAEHESYYRDYFETPQTADLSSMAKTYGLPHTEIPDIERLKNLSLLDVAAATEKGMYIIECKTNSGASMKLRQTLWSGDYAS